MRAPLFCLKIARILNLNQKIGASRHLTGRIQRRLL